MRASVYLLCVAQVATVTVAVLSVTISPNLGKMLSGGDALSTVPYGIQFLALLAGTLPIANLSRQFGRKVVLSLSALIGAAGCFIAMVALSIESFVLFCLAHAFVGIGLGAGNYYRFCALEVSDHASRATAMALVMSAGVGAALLGPSIPRLGWSFQGIGPYGVMYGIAALLFLSSCLFVFLARMPLKTTVSGSIAAKPISFRDYPPGAILGIASGAVGYFYMNLLMIEGPLRLMNDRMSFHMMSYMVELHVLGMFLPSFCSGFIIRKFGCRSVVLVGSFLLLLSGAAPMIDRSVMTEFVSLIILGVAWNFLYVAGSHLVSTATDLKLKTVLQGRNEFIVGVAAMAGAFLPGLSVELSGTSLVSSLAVGSSLVLAASSLWTHKFVITRPEDEVA